MKNIIDLPENLRPVAFLRARDVEARLTDRSREVVDSCKEIWKRGKWEQVTQVAQEAKGLWRRHGEQIGHAVAFLWLADLFWRNGMLASVLHTCEEAVEHVPKISLPAYAITTAVAYYILGLTHQASDSPVEALNSYEEALKSFEIARGYWQRVGNNEQVKSCNEIVRWVKRLIKYVGSLHLDPSTGAVSNMTLICPWRLGVHTEYLLAEFVLTQPLISTSPFLLQRSRPWLWAAYTQIDGYKIAGSLRVLHVDNATLPYTLNAINPAARSGVELLWPAGALYYAYQVDKQHAIPDRDIYLDDYCLACHTVIPDPDLPALARHKGDEEVIVGLFERDTKGHVHLREILKPPHFLGENETHFEFLGNIDFTLFRA